MQNPTFFSIFHQNFRPRLLPVLPFPIENIYSRLLCVILSYRNIPRFNIANIDLIQTPPNPHRPPTILDQHGPTWTHVGPTWVQHGTHVGATWVQHGPHVGPMWAPMGPQGTIVARDPIQKRNGTFFKDFTPEK